MQTNPATAVLDDLRRIVRVLRESSRHAEQRIGVTGAQLFVLKTLSTADSLSLNELADRTRTHQSTVSVVVKRLVSNGLVRRTTSSVDGRRLELAVTSKGRALLAKAPLAAQDRLIDGIEKLAPAHRRQLGQSLHRLVAAMELGDDAPIMFFEDEPTRGRRVAP